MRTVTVILYTSDPTNHPGRFPASEPIGAQITFRKV